MSMSVSITIKGDKETVRALRKLGSELTNFRMAMKSIGKELVRYYANDVFNSQGGAIGAKWQKLSQATIEQKVKERSLSRPLERTGTMKNSFEYNANSNSVTIGNTAPYFPYHQSKAPRTRLPRRAMISDAGEVRSIIAEIIDDDIRSKIARAGL